jgi:C4-dicarboxylate-binding protein DctP
MIRGDHVHDPPILLSLLVLICGAADSANAVAQTITIKFSHVVAADTPKGKGAEKFKELAEKRLTREGEGRDLSELDAVQGWRGDGSAVARLGADAGAVAWPSSGRWACATSRCSTCRSSSTTTRNCTRSPKGRPASALFKKLEPKGITGLAYWDNGFKQMSANRPLRKVADFRAAKMRVQSSKVLSATFRKLGAIPQVMAFSEVYTALQQGVVDGQENAALELLHAEDARGAEAPHAVRPRLTSSMRSS